MLAGLADGETSMHNDEVNSVGLAHGNFQRRMQGHRCFPSMVNGSLGRRKAVISIATPALYDENDEEQDSTAGAAAPVECASGASAGDSG